MENKDSYLETSRAERSMWLMKCPALVSRSFKDPQQVSSFSSSSSSSPSQAVAKVILSIDPLVSNDDNDSSSPQIIGTGTGSSIPTLELTKLIAPVGLSSKYIIQGLSPYVSSFCHREEMGQLLYSMLFGGLLKSSVNALIKQIRDVPKRYSMDMSKDFVPMSVFSESSQGKLSVEGKILNKFDMRPHDENIENYGKLCRERTSKYMTRSRQIQVIDNDNGTHMRPMPGMIIAAVFNEKKKTPAKTSEMKRTRRDRGEMEDIMFKLFERQPNWTLRQLIQETDQPEQFLKDILKDLCVYNNKGTNQGSYELKPEYKKATDDTNP